MATLNKMTFNGGELSPWLSPRIDIEKYHTGVEKLENMTVVRYGGVRARGGMLYLNATKDSAKLSSLQGFDFSRNDSVVVEFGDLYARFYKNGARVGAPYEIATPFSADDVRELQFAQRNDVIIITHQNYPTQEMRHMGDADWSIGEVPWTNRPWQDLNGTSTTLSVDALTGAGVTLTASDDEFEITSIGSRYRLIHNTTEISNTFSLDWAQRPQNHIEDKNSNDTPSGTFNSDGAYYTDNSLGETATGDASSTAPQPVYRVIKDYVPSAWLVGTNYVVDDVSSKGGFGYWAIQPSIAIEPEVTVGWEDYWHKVLDPVGAPQFFERGMIVMEPLEVVGDWTFETKGTWKGEWQIQRSYDDGVSWAGIKTMLSVNDANFLVSEHEEDDGTPALFRILATQIRFDGQFDNDATVFRIASRKHTGEVLVTGYTSSTETTVTVEKDVYSTDATREWSGDAFNPIRGYPPACSFHEERLYLGGVAGDPQTMWASVTNDYYNFKEGTEDDDGMKFTLAANSYDGITWFKSHKTLLIGTNGGIWSLGSTDDAPITPGNRRARIQSALGGEAISPINLNDATVYVQRKGRRVNELVGDAYSGYGVVDLTELAEHISTSGIVQVASVIQPDTMMLCVREDGELALMTYDKMNRISGWCRWITDGEIESVATIFGDGEDDEIYMIVRRDVDGQSVRYVERLTPDLIRAEEVNNNLEFVYQDSAFIYDGVETDTITGLDHLEGKTVQVLADGANAGTKTVTGGVITLSIPASKVVVGLAYTPRMRTMPIEGGQTLGERKRINAMYIRMKDTVGAQAGQGDGDWDTIPARNGYDHMDTAVPVKSQDYSLTLSNRSERQKSVEVRQVNPLPLSIIAIMPKISTGSK